MADRCQKRRCVRAVALARRYAQHLDEYDPRCECGHAEEYHGPTLNEENEMEERGCGECRCSAFKLKPWARP